MISSKHFPSISGSFLLAIFFIVLNSPAVLAQDTLHLKSGSALACKVFKISDTEIEYKKWENLDGPIYTIDKNKVHHIRFKNGVTETFLPDEMEVNTEQEILQKRNAVKLELFSLVCDKITLGYEHCMKVGWNVEGYASFISNKILPYSSMHSIYHNKLQGMAFRLSNKFLLGSDYYIKGTKYAHPLKGRFIRVDISYSRYALMNLYQYTNNNLYPYYYSLDKGNLNVSLFGLGISYGRQYILGNLFSLQHNVGVSYAIRTTQFEITEKNAQQPNGNYYYYPDQSEFLSDWYLTAPNILKINNIPLGLTGNLSIGYIIGGKKKGNIKGN